MSLIQALSTAMSGLRAAQAGLSVTAGNVANANTPGYVRENADLVETSAGSAGISVDVAGVNRTLDQLVQNQLWTETAGGSYSPLTGSAVDELSYSDSTVSSGSTYYYVVTSVDAAGTESGYSNQAKAVIP